MSKILLTFFLHVPSDVITDVISIWLVYFKAVPEMGLS